MTQYLTLPPEAIQAYRRRTFRLDPERRLSTPDEAAEFVAQRGFIYFWPITGITLPSLWAAVAGDRPVADEHDDPGHITWGWKDKNLGGRRWYYAKVLRKKATLIAFDLLPHFYALSENYGSFEDDYLTLYEQGRMTLEAKAVYEALLDKGRLDTVELRKVTRMTAPGSEGRFNKALADLQADFKITPVGVTRSGAWHYAFAYDITARHYPDLDELSRLIDERTARQALAAAYLRSVGALRLADLTKLFGWGKLRAEHALRGLQASGLARGEARIEGWPGEWSVSAEIVDG